MEAVGECERNKPMAMVNFSEKEIRFLNYMRVGRLATTDGEAIHLVPICPVFDGTVFYMATHAKTRKVRNLRMNSQTTLLIDQYSEDWMRHVAVMMTGIVEIIEKGPDFEKAKELLEAKYQQYNELFSIRGGESVILCFTPTKAVTWDYNAGELNEPH
jgi:nitroimidazol reductase NimA-like FMN-containing flavoprotein (pyridoxamine 5'-phosphate oxidase superfamily)